MTAGVSADTHHVEDRTPRLLERKSSSRARGCGWNTGSAETRKSTTMRAARITALLAAICWRR